jgi:hypothetical protein
VISKQDSNGTVVLLLRATGTGGTIGDGRLIYTPSHPRTKKCCAISVGCNPEKANPYDRGHIKGLMRMSTGDIARFGFCFEAEKIPHELENRYLGMDSNYGEVTVFQCALCRRCWVHYLMEYEYLTAAGRWLEGEISPKTAASLKADDAVPLFDKMEWFHCSGSAFGGKLRRGTPPASTWLIPFSGK